MEIHNRPPKIRGYKRLVCRIGFPNSSAMADQNETQLDIVKLGIIRQIIGLNYICVSYYNELNLAL